MKVSCEIYLILLVIKVEYIKIQFIKDPNESIFCIERQQIQNLIGCMYFTFAGY